LAGAGVTVFGADAAEAGLEGAAGLETAFVATAGLLPAGVAAFAAGADADVDAGAAAFAAGAFDLDLLLRSVRSKFSEYIDMRRDHTRRHHQEDCQRHPSALPTFQEF